MTIKGEEYYHIRVIYKSGGETSYYYEVNKSKRLAEDIAFYIDILTPSITFDGHRIYPKRIFEYKIFVTESPFEGSSESLQKKYPEGYRGDFEGDDVTLEITRTVKSIIWIKELASDIEHLSEQADLRASVAQDLGYTYWKRGDLPEALKHYEASLLLLYQAQEAEDKPKHKGVPYHMIGLIKLGLGEIEEARNFFLCAYIEDLLHGHESIADEAPAAQVLKDYFHLPPDEILPIKELVTDKKQAGLLDEIRDPNQILRELTPKGTVDLSAIFKISIPPTKLEKKSLGFPKDWEKAVFVGGNYIFNMPTIIKIKDIVKNLGYEPIIADEYKIPEKHIHHHCMMLLHACKYAILEVTTPGGQLLEIERATDWIDKDKILLICTNRSVDTVTRMVHTKGLLIEPFQDLEKDLPELISNFFARVEPVLTGLR